MQGLGINTTLYVTPYPSAWRIQLADNDIYRGFEYVRWVLNVLHHNGVAHRRTPAYQIPLGNHGHHMGSVGGLQRQWGTGEILFTATDNNLRS